MPATACTRWPARRDERHGPGGAAERPQPLAAQLHDERRLHPHRLERTGAGAPAAVRGSPLSTTASTA